jgi:hypothetical protein
MTIRRATIRALMQHKHIRDLADKLRGREDDSRSPCLDCAGTVHRDICTRCCLPDSERIVQTKGL